uniref:Myb-like domain-containing protein n=1 Tax=Photinus pyralis TaxID=7054 RepID=A0A1Y1MDI7_PHOPY
MDASLENFSEGEVSDDGLKIVLESPKRKLPRKSRTPRKLERSELDIIDSIAKDLDEKLDAKAAKINLTTINVKSILKQVVTNEHVLGFVRQSEDPQAPQTKLPFEPKLTRAKAKELFPSPTITALPWLSPKRPSEVQKLITDDLAEDSSGDEYVPMEEESEDDRISEPRSVSPLTAVKEPESEKIQWSDDGVFKIPPIKTQEGEIEEANIALRTRSKLCLSSTPLEIIEEAFIPPDITTDMYDMDCDNDDWRDFLKKFTRPLDEVTKPCEDEEHDPEYNILADEEVDKVDKEELRADRAVKVSRKEFNDMLAELFEYANNFEDNDENNASVSTINDSQLVSDISDIVDTTPQLVVPPVDVPVIPTIEPASELIYCEAMRMDQKLLLEQQLRQHVQLLAQHFLLSYQHPEYHDLSTEFKACLYNYNCLAELKENSIFKTCNLDGAIKLMNDWEKQFQLNTDEIKEMKAYVCRVLHESQTSKAAGIEYIVTFPPLIMETIARSEVFIYPDLLPIIPFKSTSLFSKFIESYTTSENQLVALGLEKFTPDLACDKSNLNGKGEVKLKRVCALIQKYFTPTKQITRLYCHIFNSKHPRAPGNPIKYYFQNRRAPVVIHYVRSLEEYGILPPCKRKKEMLPYQWKMYLYPHCAPQGILLPTSLSVPTTITKVQRPPAFNKSFATKNLRRRTVQRIPLHSNSRIVPQQLTPRNQSPATFCSTPKLTSSCTRKHLDQYFRSPRANRLGNISPKLKSFKFNSSIFNNLRKLDQDELNMLPSMPFLDGSAVGESRSPVAQLNHLDGVETEPPPAECDDDEDANQKDNEDDINALMIASSTIRTPNRRTQSATDKKRARLQREYLANLAMLTPEDPVYLQEKAQSYAQAYFDKVKERLSPEDYKEFMEVLNNFEENTCSVTELYKQIESVMGSEHSDLKEEFLTFLMPSQAKEIGKLIPYYTLSNMSLFLRKLELYFKDQPAQLRKIYRSLTYLTTCVDINMERVKATILPLLKGNNLLTDWFLQIFPSEPPPPSLLNGVWERMETRREFNLHEDVFETVNVPEMEDHYGGHNCVCTCHESNDVTFKSPGQHCVKCGLKFFQGRVYIQTAKGLRLANVTFNGNSGVDHHLRLNGLHADRRKRRSEVSPSKQFASPAKDSHDDHRISLDSEDDADGLKRKGRTSKSPRKKRVKFRDANEKVAPIEVACETPLPSEIAENIPNSDENVKMAAAISNIDECDGANEKPSMEDAGEWDCNTSIESVEVRHSPEHSAESESEFCEESSQDNINTETDESAEELESLSNSPVHSDNSNSNHAPEEVSWTRDEDKIILETLQKECGRDSAFVNISELLENRSVLQVKERVQTLMDLLQKMTSASESNSQK